MILADEDATGEVLWAATDHLGSVTHLLDFDGTSDTDVVATFTYDAFGKVVDQTGTGVEFIYGYTGREVDAESDEQYNRARYYDADIGRWLSQDPISFAAGDENLYRYVGNGPVSRTDPSGLHWGEGGSVSDNQHANAIEQWEMYNLATGRYQQSGVGQWNDSRTGLPVNGHPYFLEQSALEAQQLRDAIASGTTGTVGPPTGREHPYPQQQGGMQRW